MAKEVRVLIGGLGNAVRPVLDILADEAARIERDHGVVFRVVGVADSRGALVDPDGIDTKAAGKLKNEKGSVSADPEHGRPGMTVLQMIRECDADLYVEGLPANLPTGEPGTSDILCALERGMHVVSANKAPFALHWKELHDLADSKGLLIRCGTAASAGLPTLEMGRMLGDCGELLEFAGIFNASCMYVIDAMKQGRSYDDAVQGARAGGFLEPDPAMDLEGWDTAEKTIIQANTYWNRSCTLSEIDVKGITGLTREDILAASERGETWCMVGRAKLLEDGSLKFSTGPESLPLDHPLARARWCDKVLWMNTRTQGEQVHYCLGASASGTPGNVVLDMILVAEAMQ